MRARALLVVALVAACGSEGGREHPTLVVRAADRERILARLDRMPYALLHERLATRAARPWRERADPAVWDYRAEIDNAATTQASATLAWLHGDEAAAARAREGLARMTVDLETNETWDLNIRVPDITMGYTNAWDLLAGTPFFPADEAAAARARIEALTAAIYDRYVVDSVNRAIALAVSQNNHPIRTAAAIGYPALLFRDHADAGAWLDWAVSELDYLWGPDGRYVQPDGGISEGPDYFRFAFAPSVAFFVAADNALDPDHVFARDCTNRSSEDPWLVVDCVPGEPFRFENPLRTERFWATAAWSMAIRLPDGRRPPLEDARFTPHAGQAILTGMGAPGYLRWDWETVVSEPMVTERSADLTLHHLAYLDDATVSAPPPWLHRYLPVAGHAVFRSGWDADAVWLMVTAENGAARKTLHDHVDGTSFTLAAYGEYLLMDSGYFKTSGLDNARTAHAPSHNVILIDGRGAPDKGLLTNWGDADAFLETFADGRAFAYVEARQRYQDTGIRRSVILARGRYAVVADRLDSAREPREHRWRLHGHAGLDSGGVFAVEEHGGRWQRERAGVRQYLASTAGPVRFEEPPLVRFEPPHVHELESEGDAGHHAVLDGVVTAAAPGFLAVLAPYRVGAAAGAPDAALDVEAVAVDGARAAWLVTSTHGRDLVLLRAPDAPLELAVGAPAIAVRTDAEVVVVGLDDGSAVIARGTFVEVGGQRREASASAGAAIIE